MKTPVGAVVTDINQVPKMKAVHVLCIFMYTISFNPREFYWWPEFKQSPVWGQEEERWTEISCFLFVIPG